jgi:hypothetical protein
MSTTSPFRQENPLKGVQTRSFCTLLVSLIAGLALALPAAASASAPTRDSTALGGNASASGSALSIGAVPSSSLKVCSSRYVHATLSWGHKCLAVGQFCKVRNREYLRYGFYCPSSGHLRRR